VHFALGMGYQKIGLAFCWELFRETEILTPVLARFFTVFPVCCRIGSAEEPGPDRTAGGNGSVCNPVAQAAVLEKAKTELNVLVGACMGSDLLFTAHSHAPVTTLFVKDRTLAHNPVGAIYTRYHLEALRRSGSSPIPEGGRGDVEGKLGLR
ncbi:MAG: DUF1847 domain-containing protein, partial [Candidatus Latescibacteria bacterium]|nr:DUF1847 domain-containing protein [Candidatus Latescibacterota bacterium]